MPRLAGVDIPGEKITVVALQYIHGVGARIAKDICEKAGLDPQARSKELTEDQLSKITSILDSEYVIEGQLRRQVQQNVARLKDIGSYRGLRHRRGLPVRGQRTKTNARTRKGPRKTVAGKKSVKEMR
ncbi:MAG TPA: 30S ribosomal protein S13 [Phycisphaerae bacterium]|nr:30S ribosomal protein S13 [Phycisphaerae bacterium]HQL72864.1 30S ribosomal protein S13 [Phycisphaerae bacterium]